MQNEIKAQYDLADFYKKHYFDKDLPRAEIFELRDPHSRRCSCGGCCAGRRRGSRGGRCGSSCEWHR